MARNLFFAAKIASGPNGLDTALHITSASSRALCWGNSHLVALARPSGRASWHDQMLIELNSLDLNREH
jgi:hypothetical protein